jgi:hypothetical protein
MGGLKDCRPSVLGWIVGDAVLRNAPDDLHLGTGQDADGEGAVGAGQRLV